MSEWKLVGGKAVDANYNDKTSHRKHTLPDRVPTGIRIYVNCITNDSFIIDAIEAGVLKNVTLTESTDDSSRFQVTLVDYDSGSDFMSMSSIELDHNRDDVDSQLKNQYFSSRDKVTALWRKSC